MFPYGYRGESELEYYGKLSPDEEKLICDGCGDDCDRLSATGLCKLCYNEKVEEECDSLKQ